MTNAPTQSQARARQMLEQAYAPASSGLDLEAEMMLQGIGPAINALAAALTPASDDATVERVARAIHEADSPVPWEATINQDVAYRRARAAVAAFTDQEAVK